MNTTDFHSLFWQGLAGLLALLALPELSALSLTEVAEDSWVHQGKHLELEHEHSDDIANVGFIIGTDCVAVIDTGGSLRQGERLRAAIRKLTHKPVCYVINTHIHFDHLLGNRAFADADTQFVGHARLAEAIERNREFFVENFPAYLGPDPDPAAIIAPTLLVSDTLELDLGGRTLELIATSPAHSHSDLVVFDRNTGTLWSGDLIFRERIPVLEGSLKGWLGAIETLRELPVRKVVPGHGPIADSLDIALQPQQSYLELLLNETRAAIRAGEFVNEASTRIDRDNRFGWLLFEPQHAINVRKAFTELEWE